MVLELAGLYLYAYLAGAVPTPYLIARLIKGIDIREYGSGNVGGSNVIRQMGRKWVVPLAAIEFLLKGLSPSLLAYLVLADEVSGPLRAYPLFLGVPLLALVGNNWPIFLRFQGGRGLMVVCGIVLALAPVMFPLGMLVYLVGWKVSGSSAVWALVAVAILPVLSLVPGGITALDWQGVFTLAFDGTLSPSGSDEVTAISLFCGAILCLVVLKRLVANSLQFPESVSTSKVLFNRLFRDRDVDDREQWVGRAPD